MAEKKKKPDDESGAPASDGGGGTATAKPKKAKGGTATKPASTPKKDPPGLLPPWKVLLHNDDKNDVDHVIGTIVELTPAEQAGGRARGRGRPTRPASPCC